MVDLNRLKKIEPQVTEEKYGPEPSLEDIVREFYASTWKANDGWLTECTDNYFKSLGEEYERQNIQEDS